MLHPSFAQKRLLQTTTYMMAAQFLKRVPIPPRGVDFRGKVVMAPMVRSSELPLRRMALQYGADLVWGPEIVDRAIVGATRRVNEAINTIDWSRPDNHYGIETVVFRAQPQLEGRRLIFQLGTADPALAVQAARLVAGDVAGIDVNAGCPKPYSTLGGMGAALLQTPDRLCAILEALVATISSEFGIGISVKIRLLPDPVETANLVRRVCATGITGLTVHCRYPSTRPKERALRDQLPDILAICRDAGVACLINGDVRDHDHARELMAAYDADGAMIASAAEANPSCFRTRADGGLLPWQEIVSSFIHNAVDTHHSLGKAKLLLTVMADGPAAQLASICKSYTELCERLDVPDALEKARVVDEIHAKKDKERGDVATHKKLIQKAEKLRAAMMSKGTQGPNKRKSRPPWKRNANKKSAKDDVDEMRQRQRRTPSPPAVMSAEVPLDAI